jgi:hypothetical protein
MVSIVHRAQRGIRSLDINDQLPNRESI